VATLTATKVTPLGDGVLIRPRTREDKTAGGIILPDTAKEKPQEGTVVAIGPGRRGDEGKRLEMQVAVEQTVLYSKYAGTEITVEGVEHLLLKESDILAVIRD
jgi:chaperonin GroES